jgi:signal transduction histidine kinase
VRSPKPTQPQGTDLESADFKMNATTEQRSGTDRRRSRRLEQSRLRSIVERMADGILIVSLDGTIRFANPAAQLLFGRRADELEGAPLGFPCVTAETAEIEIVRPGGAAVAAELRVSEIDWEGELARLVSLRDVTDRKRAEEKASQLERERLARAEAEAASQAKSEFLAMMSHELRTPLNAVIGYAELLDLGIAGPVSSEQRHNISRIRASARHLLGLVNEVLDLAKVEAGRLSLQMGVARANVTADEAIALVQPAANARGIELTAHCPADLDAVYEGDVDRVRQILVNLLTNGVKFTEPGGRVHLECGVTTEPSPEARVSSAACVSIRVEDTGIGIPREQLARIFDPFVQVERGHTRHNDGSGLGLTVSRRLARLMKGDLTVRSDVGKGSTFTLWLPCASDAARETARLQGDSSDTASRLQGLAEIGETVIREIGAMVTAFVDRLRADPIIPPHSLRFSLLADHAATYLADIGAVLIAVEESRGHPSTLVADGTEIQRSVAERHGAQRAGLGWNVEMLRREWAILGEEIERVIRRKAHGARDAAVSEAIVIVGRFIEQAEEISCRALTRTLQQNATRASRESG